MNILEIKWLRFFYTPCRKICSGIGALRRIKPFVPLRSLKMLYKPLIRP